MDIDLGSLAFFNKRGSKEIYKAYRLELHFPSEHYITLHGQTPRYALELQIFHYFSISSQPSITHKFMKVNKAVLSILYTVGSSNDGDEMLEALGISRYNRSPSKQPYLAKQNDDLNMGEYRVGLYDAGFSVKALQGLLNSINSDHHIYHYYGSETSPPCREEVLWFVFARPRSISKYQFDFLKAQLAKTKDEGRDLNLSIDFTKLYGNKRSIQKYDDSFRGKIYSNLKGLRQVKRHSFFRKQEQEQENNKLHV